MLYFYLEVKYYSKHASQQALPATQQQKENPRTGTQNYYTPNSRGVTKS